MKNQSVEEINKRFWGDQYKPGWIGPGEVKSLFKPSPGSHKGENGQLLVFAGSEKFHGPLVYAAKTASKFVDLVFVYSVEENSKLLKKAKEDLADFIPVNDKTLDEYANRVDCILMGPGIGKSVAVRSTMEKLIKDFPDKKFLLDADALGLLGSDVLNDTFVVTPHAEEFKKFFGVNPSRESAAKMAERYGCTIVLKGSIDYIRDQSECKENHAGNAGMTKGGTGDVLAGLIAALMTKNDNFLAASAGVFLNGLAGDRLAKKVSYWYSASDLVDEIPKTRKWCEDF